MDCALKNILKTALSSFLQFCELSIPGLLLLIALECLVCYLFSGLYVSFLLRMISKFCGRELIIFSFSVVLEFNWFLINSY